MLLFPLVCRLIRQQQVIGASGSDSLTPLAQMLAGGTVGFIAGQDDFHQGLTVSVCTSLLALSWRALP